jgi:hypothetical protein
MTTKKSKINNNQRRCHICCPKFPRKGIRYNGLVGGTIAVAGRKGGQGREKLTEWGEEEGLDGEERRVDLVGSRR